MPSSTANDTDADRTDGNQSENGLTSRRTMLKTTAVVGATVGVGGVAFAQSGDDPLQSTTIEFGGEVAGWMGRAPSSIEGETNPTLALQAGTSYTVTWENTDGQPHNFQVLDSGGNVLHKTEIVSEQGATQTTSFTATTDMAQYNCVVHPSSMVGDVTVQGQSGTGGNETNQSAGNETNQSAGNETNQSVQPTEVGQSTNASTNESGGLGDWNVTANGSAEPEVVDEASANPSTNVTSKNEGTNETEEGGDETTGQNGGGNEVKEGSNGKAKSGNGKAKSGSGKRD